MSGSGDKTLKVWDAEFKRDCVHVSVVASGGADRQVAGAMIQGVKGCTPVRSTSILTGLINRVPGPALFLKNGEE